VFGHDAKQKLQIHQRCIGLDTGCCYGNAMTGLCLPEWNLVAVPASRMHCPPRTRTRAGAAAAMRPHPDGPENKSTGAADGDGSALLPGPGLAAGSEPVAAKEGSIPDDLPSARSLPRLPPKVREVVEGQLMRASAAEASARGRDRIDSVVSVSGTSLDPIASRPLGPMPVHGPQYPRYVEPPLEWLERAEEVVRLLSCSHEDLRHIGSESMTKSPAGTGVRKISGSGCIGRASIETQPSAYTEVIPAVGTEALIRLVATNARRACIRDLMQEVH